jgi:2-keto-4-pentenoate hydratase/2-oxohepta-3-ene-1,7-dioic acid hydratase in catechol pathway
MRLLRVGPPGHERPAGLDADGVLRDLSGVVGDIDARLFSDPVALRAVREALAAGDLPAVGDDVRIGAPIARPGKVVGLGLNYRDFAAIARVPIPAEPDVFLKPSTTVTGPYDDVVLPPGSTHTDHEVELGVVLGRELRGTVTPEDALAAVAGYVTGNDITERARLVDEPTWAKGKCADTFTPIGPWLVTADEVADPQGLTLELQVNGEVRQYGGTALMAVRVGELLAYVSSLMTLEPGDLVLTGTPAGVAAGRPEPKPYLRDGDVMEAEVFGLGRQRTPVVG